MNNYAATIKECVSIKEAAERYGVSFNRAGFALCPFHSEKTASFKLKNRYQCHCFGCGRNDDVISLTMGLLNITFQEAIDRLNEDFGVGLPLRKKTSLRDRLELSKKVREIKSASQKQKEFEESVKAKHDKLMALYCKYEAAIRTLKPKNKDECPNPLYIEAINNIEYIEYQLDNLPDLP